MLREKRMTARGGRRSSISLSESDSAVADTPTQKRRAAVLMLLQPLLQRGQEREGGDRRHVVRVETPQLLQDQLLRGREEQELSLPRALSFVPREHRSPLHVELLFLEVPEDLAGPRGDGRRQTGQLRDLD